MAGITAVRGEGALASADGARKAAAPEEVRNWEFIVVYIIPQVNGAQPPPNTDLTYMHTSITFMHMKTRTTLILDDELLEEARKLTGLDEKTAVVHAGLKALIMRESARQLAELGGSQPDLKPIPRRRSRSSR